MTDTKPKPRIRSAAEKERDRVRRRAARARQREAQQHAVSTPGSPRKRRAFQFQTPSDAGRKGAKKSAALARGRAAARRQAEQDAKAIERETQVRATVAKPEPPPPAEDGSSRAIALTDDIRILVSRRRSYEAQRRRDGAWESYGVYSNLRRALAELSGRLFDESIDKHDFAQLVPRGVAPLVGFRAAVEAAERRVFELLLGKAGVR